MAAMISLGGVSQTRQRGTRYPNDMYRCSRNMGTLLSKLHNFRDATDNDARFPLVELNESFELLKSPSLFGGQRGFPEPLLADKSSITASEDFDIDIPNLDASSLNVSTLLADNRNRQIKMKEGALEVSLDLSSKYNINEKIAVNYWLDASDPAIQLELVTHFGCKLSVRDAADHLYCMDRNHLIEVIILLMKMRENNEDNTPQLNPDKHIAVIRFTNKLLRKGPDSMIKILLSVIKMDSKKKFYNSTSKSILSTVTNYLQKLALAVFHSCYQLQVTLDEEQDLLRVMKELTKDVVNDESDEGERDQSAIQKGLHSALVVLQLTYVHIFRADMFVVRPDHDAQDPDGNFTKDPSYENSLSRIMCTEMKQKEENGKLICLYRDIDKTDEINWPQSSLVSNGLIYLAYGRLEHYKQEHSRVKNVLGLFREASQRRAYSYMRLCMLPILQDKKAGDSMNDSFTLLTKVLKLFLWELSIIFSDEDYAHDSAVLDQNAFPFFKLVPDKGDHVGVKKGLGLAQLPIGQSDTFVDVTLLYGAFIAALPSFAVQYISNNADARPFLDKVIQGTHHPKMERAAFRLLTALASSPYKIDDEFAPKKVYDILKRGSAPAHFRLEYFAKTLSDFAHLAGMTHDDPNHAARARLSAASSWAELEPDRPFRGPDGWNQGQIKRDLTEEEENDIVSITGLYAAIASQPRLPHLEEAIRPDLVNTFFKLLACPLSIATKGSIFRALAAYSRNCNDEYCIQEVWRLLIQHRLLPNSKDLLSGITEESFKQGLRAELEDTESRAGLYSITDGLLLLLDALLSHGPLDQQHSDITGGASKGFVLRKQDLLVYLEYVVDDILGNVNNRYYNDSHNPQQSSAQKWRIYARSLKVLSTILQHYSVNLLGGEHGDDENINLSILDDKSRIFDLQSDFLEDDSARNTTISSNTNTLTTYGNGLNNSENVSRHIKSPGFMIMTMLLTHSKCSLQGSIMELLRLSGYDKVLETDQKNKLRASFNAIKVMCDSRTTDRGYLVNPNGTDNLDLLGFVDGVFDSAYWHVKAISAMTGLLYECVIREQSFINCVKMSPHITMTFTHGAKLVQQPIGAVNSLAHTFALFKYENRNESALAHVAMLLQFPNNICTSVPSVPIMASYIMKTVANDFSSRESLIGSAILENIGGYDLVRGCSHIIQEGDSPLGGQVFPVGLYPLGADVLPDIYSENPRARLPCEAPKVSRIIDRVKATKRRLQSARSEFIYEGGETFESISDTLLDLLVTTLAPRTPCFAHILLGLDTVIFPQKGRRSSNVDHPLSAGDGIRDPDEFPATCLEAVLYILNDAVSLVLHNAERAMLCYELVYRLCAAPLTNLIVLSFLRRECTRFLPKHIGYCMRLLNMTDREILEYCDFDEQDTGGDQHYFKERCNECINRAKYARLNCCAWLLKICALELRALSSSNVTSTFNVDAILLPLLSEVFGGRGDHITLTSMLLSASNTPDEVYPQFSELMRRIMKLSTVPLYVERGSVYAREYNAPSIIDKFIFARLCAIEGGVNPNDPQYIDQAGYEHALTDITNLNWYIKYAAAAKHFCVGWNQCIGMALYLHKIDLGNMVQRLLLPTLEIINTPNKLEVDMPELVASAMFTMVSVLYRNAIADDQQTLPITTILDQEQQRILLQGLVNAAIHSVHRAGTSVRYCSDLVRCIGVVLAGLSGFHEPSLVISPTLREPVDDEVIRKSKLSDAPWGNVSRVEEAETYRNQTIQILEQNVGNLVDSVSREVCSGPGTSRLAAACTLQAILSVLGPAKSADNFIFGHSTMQATGRFKHVLGSHAFSQALQVLVQRGYLQQILSVIGPISSTRQFTGAIDGSLQDQHDERDMFISTLSICTQMSCTVEGVDVLVQHGNILQRILNLSLFCNPPPATDDIVFASSNVLSSIEWEDKFLMVIRLLRTMSATSPTRDVLQLCAEFLRKNHVSITYLLRFKHKNIFGLALVESLLSVFSLIASAPCLLLRRSTSFAVGDRVEIKSDQMGGFRIGRVVRVHSDSTYEIDFEDGFREQRFPLISLGHCSANPSTAGILWDDVFERFADSFTADICGVLKVLGKFDMLFTLTFPNALVFILLSFHC